MPKSKLRRVNPTRKIKVKEGALHQQLGIPEDEGIPTSKLEELKKSKRARAKPPRGETKKRAVFALNASKWRRPAHKPKTKVHRGMSKTERSVWNSLSK